jgi:hypothetical protein
MGFWWRVGEIIYFLLVGWGTLLCGNRQFNGGDSHMNIANSVNMTQSSAEFSILKSASKQPELALQLLMKTLAGSQSSA